MAIGSVLQVYGMDEGKYNGDDAVVGRYGSMGGHASASPASALLSVSKDASREREDYFRGKHTEALGDELASRVCADLFGEGANPWVRARPVGEILAGLSRRLAGGEAEPLLSISVSQRRCEDAVFLNMVHRLNTIANPNSPEALWTVCRAVLFLLSNRKITNCLWLRRISAAGDDVVTHLIGDRGVVTSVLGAFSERGLDLSRFIDGGRGKTNVFELSAMFLKAAKAFLGELWRDGTHEEQRRPLYGSAFAGARRNVSMAEVFDSAFLNADFRISVPEVAVSLLSQFRDVTAAAAVSGDRLERAEQKLGLLESALDNLSCCIRFFCCCCAPSVEKLYRDLD